MAESEPGSVMRTAKLVQRLCNHLSPETDEDRRRAQLKYAIRILGSRLESSLPQEQQYLSALLQRRLVADGTANRAVGAAEHVQRLYAKRVLRKPEAALTFLHHLTHSPTTTGSTAAFHQTMAGLSSLSQGLPPRTSPSVPSTQVVPHLRGRTLGAKGKAPRQQMNLRLQQQLQTTDSYQSQITESMLLRDVVMACHGVSGRYITYDHRIQAFRVDPSVGVPAPTRQLVSKLVELGWLFNQLKLYIDTCRNDLSYGLIGQAFCTSLSGHITEYYRLIALLESQIDTAPVSEDSRLTLTLRRLVVWTHDPLLKLQTLVSLIDVCSGLKGGQLLSVIYKFAQHGDVKVQALVQSVLQPTLKPMYAMLHLWVFDGVLNDRYGEFMIAVNPSVTETEHVRDRVLLLQVAAALTGCNQMWSHKFLLRESMVPDFISTALAGVILNSGKTVDFIRSACGTLDFKLDALSSVHNIAAMPEQKGFDCQSTEPLKLAASAAYSAASQALLKQLISNLGLFSHLRVLRQTLLLGQGDFIRHLMDMLSTELERPASQLFLHNLTGVLEAARRVTNWDPEDAEALERLDVKLMEASPGDCGWDVFSLAYHVSGPLSAIFTAENMIKYLTIFNFLWRGKRIEFTLAALWNEQLTSMRLVSDIPGLNPVLHDSRMLAAEMTHFIKEVQYYMLFEVLESSWHELQTRVVEARGLDDVIAAHNTFLSSVLQRMFLTEQHQAVLSQLRSVFDLVVEFQLRQEKLHTVLLDEREYRRKNRAAQAARSARGQWAVDAPGEQVMAQHEAKFYTTIEALHGDVTVIAKSLQAMIGRFLIMLTQHTDSNLKSLSARIDFNETYKLRIPQYAEAVSPMRRRVERKTRPPPS